MSDYIIRQSVEKLKPHPINETLYDFDENQHLELVKSIEKNGLLEPITIDNQNYVYSGHRRLRAVKELGWIDIDCRLTHISNPIIQIIESNHQRKKTTKEILRESELLKKEYQKYNGQGKRNDLNGVGKNWSIVNVSNQIGVSLTNLKRLKSIQHYNPSLLDDIDLGKISIGKAYQLVKSKHFPNNSNSINSNGDNGFKKEFRMLLKKYNPPLSDIFGVMNKTKPYDKITLGSFEPKVDKD
jgi:hypothetical protein